jgi:hypothetical protein
LSQYTLGALVRTRGRIAKFDLREPASKKLAGAWRYARADEVTLQYLEYLSNDDTAIDFIKNRIKFWADPLRKHGADLPWFGVRMVRYSFPV